MRWFRWVALGVLLATVLACGGGGGGTGSSGGTLRYLTNWAGRLNPGGGLSQRISIYNSTNVLQQSLVVNFDGAASNELTFDPLAAGRYSVIGELYSQPNLGGINTGLFSQSIDVSGTSTISTEVGATITGLTVTPQTATAAAPASIQYFVTPTTSSNEATFYAPGSVTWSVLGGVGSITPEGLLTVNGAANGSVRATHTPTGRTGAATFSVTLTPPTQTKWTIFIYLNAANDLYTYSDFNMNQLEKVATNPDVRYVVQWKQSRAAFPNSSFDGCRRYLVRPDGTNAIASQIVQDLGVDTDMGNPQTMLDFIQWGKQFYPAQRYGVVVWNHGNGWRSRPGRAVSYDDQSHNAIQTWQLQDALGSEHFDFLAWDASLMQMLEVAYEVRSNATFIVGSEESPPGEGYPYDDVFAKFRDNPDDTTRNLTKAFVDGMVNEPGYGGENITQSVLESSKLPALKTAVNDLAQSLIANNSSLTSLIPQIRSQAQGYSTKVSPPRYYRDLIDVCLRLEAGSGIASLNAKSAAVRAAAQNAIVWEGHNSHSPGSRGIAIDFTQGTVFLSSASNYARMDFGQETLWDDWLVISP